MKRQLIVVCFLFVVTPLLLHQGMKSVAPPIPQGETKFQWKREELILEKKKQLNSTRVRPGDTPNKSINRSRVYGRTQHKTGCTHPIACRKQIVNILVVNLQEGHLHGGPVVALALGDSFERVPGQN